MGHSGRRWLIDPLTAPATSCAVTASGASCSRSSRTRRAGGRSGALSLLGETYWASRGEGAWCNGERLHVSAVDRLSQAVLSPNGLHHPAIRPYAARVTEFLQRVWTVRTYGGALDACLLAGGHIDAWFEAKAEVWDLAPLRIIIEEAGGHYISPAGVAAIACTPALEREMWELFGGVRVTHRRDAERRDEVRRGLKGRPHYIKLPALAVFPLFVPGHLNGFELGFVRLGRIVFKAGRVIPTCAGR